jgi:hypothetical protein
VTLEEKTTEESEEPVIELTEEQFERDGWLQLAQFGSQKMAAERRYLELYNIYGRFVLARRSPSNGNGNGKVHNGVRFYRKGTKFWYKVNPNSSKERQ